MAVGKEGANIGLIRAIFISDQYADAIIYRDYAQPDDTVQREAVLSKSRSSLLIKLPWILQLAPITERHLL